MLSSSIKKNELVALIKSLQRTEKAFYKKMAKRHAAANEALHLQLFELMDKYPDAEEKFFFERLQLKSASHFSGLKNYLWDDLLDTLVFLRRKEPLVQLQNLDAEIDILLHKNLGASAEKLLSDAWAVAKHLNLYSEQQNILKHRFVLLYNAGIKHFEAESKVLISLQHKVIRKIYLEQQIRMYLRELAAIKQFTYLHLTEPQLKQVQDTIEQLHNIALETDEPFLQLCKNLGLSMAFHLSYRFHESEVSARAALAVWTEAPQLIIPNQTLFLITIDFALYNAFALNDLELAAYYHQVYQKLVHQHFDKKDYYKWDIVSFNTRLKIQHKRANYELVKQLMDEEAESILTIIRQRASRSQTISILCSCLISYFVLEQYQQAENLLMDVKELNHTAGREDVLYFITIFQMVLLFEMKKDLQLYLAINASYAQLYNQRKLNPFEKELMLFLKRLINRSDSRQQVKAITTFIKKLDEYHNDPIKQLYFLYFNFYDWLQSKALRIPYTSYKKKLLNQNQSSPRSDQLEQE